MRLLPLLTAAILPFSALAAKKSVDRFDTASSKAQPVRLDDNAYDKLTKAPRDYSVAVLLTALDARFACQLCHDFHPEWDLLAKSWTKGDKKKESRLVFATLDFMDGKATFQSVCTSEEMSCGSYVLICAQMMLQTAPVLVFFPPTTGPHAKTDKPMERLDFNTG